VPERVDPRDTPSDRLQNRQTRTKTYLDGRKDVARKDAGLKNNNPNIQEGLFRKGRREGVA